MANELTTQVSPEIHANHQEVVDKIEKLKQALLVEDPEMATYLKQIHLCCLQQQELVYVLSDEQLTTYIQGLKKVAGVKLAQATATSVKKKSGKSLTLADLGLE